MNADGTGFSLLAPFTAGDGQPGVVALGARARLHRRQGPLRSRTPATTQVAPSRGGRGADPDWSARNRIAFERGGSIFSVKPSGRGLRRIARGSDPELGGERAQPRCSRAAEASTRSAPTASG